MRRALLLSAIAFLAGCREPQEFDRELSSAVEGMENRVQMLDTSKKPPSIPLPENPPKQIDVQKVRAESAKVTALKIEDVKVGSGPVVENGKYVSVHYVGFLPDGYVFDTSYKNDLQPFTFQYDPAQPPVIDGWMQALKGMRVGGHRKVTIPASLAYGDSPPPGSPIPPGSALTFDILLLFISEYP